MNGLISGIFDIIVNIFQAAVETAFVFLCVSKKQRFKGHVYTELLCFIALFAALTVSNFVYFYEGLLIFLLSFILFLFLYFFADGTVPSKIFLSIVPMNAVSVGSVISTNLMSFILKKPIYDFLAHDSAARIVTVIFSNAIFVSITVVVYLLMKHYRPKLKAPEWLILSGDLILSIIAYSFLLYLFIDNNSFISQIYIAVCATIILLINLAAYYLLVNYSHHAKTDMENALLRQQILVQEKSVKETREQYDALKKIKHDFSNTLFVIRELSQNGENDKIAEIIKKYQDEQMPTVKIVDTGNEYINAILNTKIMSAKQKGILTVCSIAGVGTEPNIDLCNLLGNMFDNAIRASSVSERKQIELTVNQADGELSVLMKNTIDGSVLDRNPHLHSDKPDKHEHGYGTKIIREIADRYNGFADFFEKDGYFCCHVTMYNIVRTDKNK